MKLKVLYITFNIVLFGLLFTVFFLPLLYADGSIAREFWSINWVFSSIFLIIILVINIIFFRNRRLVEAIESEDWTALSRDLEEQIFDKKKMSFKNVRLLIESLLLLSDFPTINRLEVILRNNKPEFIPRLAPKFAASKLLSGNFADLLDFTEKFSKSNQTQNEWMSFYYAFALQLLHEYDKSVIEFKKLQEESPNKLIKVLSSYFFLSVLKSYNKLLPKEIDAKFADIKSEINKSFTQAKWKRFIAKEKQEIHIMVLTKLIDSATDWIFN